MDTPAVKPDPAIQKAKNRATLARVKLLFFEHKSKLTQLMLVVLIAVILGLVPPWLLMLLINQGFQAGDYGKVVEYSLLTVLFTLMAAAATLWYGWLGVLMGQEIMCDLRLKLFKHLQGMSLRFFTSTRTGDIQTRLISDIGGVQEVVSNSFTDAISNFAIVISALIAMFIMDWRLTLLAIGLTPLFMWMGSWIGEFARKVRIGVQEQTSEINSMMQENLSVSGALLAKTIGQQEKISNDFARENQKLAGWQIKAVTFQYAMFGMFRMVTQMIPALVYWFAGWLVSKGDPSITVGKLVAFTSLQIRLFFPLTGLMAVQVQLLSSVALFERIFEYFDIPHDVKDSPEAVEMPVETVEGKVEFRNVSFKYETDKEHWTLRNIDFTAEPGKLYALVGPSGAGKTTLTYMIPRLYDPDEGELLLDGVPLKDVQLSSLSKLVGAVTQETYLIHTTIKENLRVAKPEATDEELIEACKAAAIHDHIASLDEGYDTVVGERGYKLSGGEKQRLAIARAILKNPRILILDEATSALDTNSERLIQNSLNQLMEGRTTFAIAHRLSTILAAHRILVMDGGRIVEQGTHDELLANKALYFRLFTEQFSTLEKETSSNL